MKKENLLLLDQANQHVTDAYHSEKELYEHYGLETKNHYIKLNQYGIRVRVVETGSGDPILIVPGNTGESFPFIPLMPELKGKRILALNRPGGGLSEGMDHRKVNLRTLAVDTIEAVLDYFKLERVPIIAHSMGGQWSLWFSIDRPKRVTKLSLLGVPGNLPGTHVPKPLLLTTIPGLNKVLFGLIKTKGTEGSLKNLLFMGHSKETCNRLPSELTGCYYFFQRLPHYQTSSISLMEASSYFYGPKKGCYIEADELAKIETPVMIYWGADDPFGSIDAGQKIAAMIPNCCFYELQKGGHLPWLDDISGCGRIVMEFLSR